MPNRRISQDIRGWQGHALALGVVAAAQAAVLVPTLAAGDVTAGTAASGLIVAALVLATAVLTNVYWRISETQLAGWLTVSLTLIAAPNLTLAGTVLAEPAAVRSEPFWPLMMQLLISATLLLVALIGLGIAIEYLKDNPVQDWLERCPWGISPKERYHNLVTEQEQLALALKG